MLFPVDAILSGLAEHGQEYDGGQFDATGREFAGVYAKRRKE